MLFRSEECHKVAIHASRTLIETGYALQFPDGDFVHLEKEEYPISARHINEIFITPSKETAEVLVDYLVGDSAFKRFKIVQVKLSLEIIE